MSAPASPATASPPASPATASPPASPATASPATASPPAIDARGVRRVYKAKPKDVVALDGVDPEVAPGEFFGLLGPNGAGKTTLIKILTTLLLPTSGSARVFGFDVARETKQIRRLMNIVSGGEQSGYGILTVREQLWMFTQFYGLPGRQGWQRVDELIEAVGVGEQRDQRVSTLSTGQRQKMNFARGLLNDPWVLFLDEPTLGLDVAAARSVRELVVDWKAAVPGRTILLTTHYMAEADELCERIAIVDRGRILAIGTPAELKRRVQRDSIFRLELDRLDAGPAALGRLPGVVSAVTAGGNDGDGVERQTVVVNLALADDAALGPVVGALGGLGAHIVALAKSEPSLEDVFVELVGRGFAEEASTDRTGSDDDQRDRAEVA
ncbi:MAG TPA: ATP-binding cassette domain-containing protein [Candidatus Limnocylindrales bacterium]|nr:ATP-binding cassette domain-containing protein [Candidatus Limnocylindrales bacterium]